MERAATFFYLTWIMFSSIFYVSFFRFLAWTNLVQIATNLCPIKWENIAEGNIRLRKRDIFWAGSTLSSRDFGFLNDAELDAEYGGEPGKEEGNEVHPHAH